ncbi:hypothetical protein ACFLU3_00370 [Chloroflexota bacterium]
MIDKILETLDQRELEIATSILEIPENIISQEQSLIEEYDDRVRINIVSRGDSNCPFEILFGRKEHYGKMSWFVGLGAEVFDIEEVDNPEAARNRKEDIEKFLKSKVRCEMHIAKGKIRKALYFPSLYVVQGQELSFAYVGDYIWPFVRTTKEVLHYEPWI